MTVFDDMVDDLFADGVLAQDAVYTPLGQPPLPDPVRVTLRAPESSVIDALGGTDLTDPLARVLRVRRSEVAMPVVGDELSTGGETYRVTGDPEAESGGLVWRLSAVQAA